jgi:hypothetical protein
MKSSRSFPRGNVVSRHTCCPCPQESGIAAANLLLAAERAERAERFPLRNVHAEKNTQLRALLYARGLYEKRSATFRRSKKRVVFSQKHAERLSFSRSANVPQNVKRSALCHQFRPSRCFRCDRPCV